MTEAGSLCDPTTDETGEAWCPGTEWPLYDLWEGTTTPEAVRRRLEAEDQAITDWEASMPLDGAGGGA